MVYPSQSNTISIQDTIPPYFMQMRRFPEKLRTLREQHHMTQRDLASELDLTQGHIYLLESGRRKPSVDLVLKMAQLFRVTPDQLLLDDVELNPL